MLTKVLDPQRDYFRWEGLKCVFKLYFLFFRQIQLEISRFLDKFYRVAGIPKIFFKIFQPFFAKIWRFENFERPFCKKVSKVQPPFFFIKRII